MANFGTLRYEQGKLAEAEEYCRCALEGREATLGKYHPDTLILVDNFGVFCLEQVHLDEAEMMM